MAYLAKIYVTLKPSVSDPAGQTVLAALRRMGHDCAEDARIGKYLELRVGGDSADSAADSVDRMCRELLSNPVIEDYRFELLEIAAS
ncbi:MAG: phosphoribosylformylglycinamidine synthase subunit PurS [Chloroflexi bacterium]|nr:phosphoribosylformylglycinamidine synthase subunit PurS [Chloroflexota bacterium]MYE40783.1 phosphoribosylformylglycinamidine synthase subunit PurS [Chloroflexota bacterium]